MIKACDKALEEKDTALNLANLALNQAKHDVADLNALVDEKDRELGAWYRSPWLWIAVGLVGGRVLLK